MNICPQCKKEISKPYNKFCNSSCSAKYNNVRKKKHIETRTCVNCLQNYVCNWHTSTGKFCSLKCTGQYKSKQNKVQNKKLFEQGKLVFRRHIYDILVEKNGNKCTVCGLIEWNKKPIRLWVDHINGDPSDHSPTNFRLICPNCESQTDTSRGKNYGNGRTSKGMKPYS